MTRRRQMMLKKSGGGPPEGYTADEALSIITERDVQT